MKVERRITKQRERRTCRVRNRVRKSAYGRPRLSVFRSNKHIYVQIIDDDARRTLLAASTLEKEVAGAGRQSGVSYGTDAPIYAATGVPSVVFGPGSILQAHTADEWLALDELEKAAEILYRFGRGGLGD